jgi:putative membrane protein
LKEKDIIKTVFSFFIIDLIIFSFFAIIIAFFIAALIKIAFLDTDIGDIFWLLYIIILLVLMYWNYKYRYLNKFKEEDAIKILEIRYAKGEITKKEFEKMKNDLKKEIIIFSPFD